MIHQNYPAGQANDPVEFAASRQAAASALSRRWRRCECIRPHAVRAEQAVNT